MTAAAIAESGASSPNNEHRLMRTAVLVALVTAHELARRRGALALALLLPLVFYLVLIDTHWTALRLLSIGLGWAAATLALFTSVASRSIDLRLAASGASPTALVLGRHTAVLGLGWIITALYSGLVLLTIGDKLTHPAAVPLMLLLTVTVAAPLGSVAAALVPRDLEGALLLLAVMALQLLVDPAADWTRGPIPGETEARSTTLGDVPRPPRGRAAHTKVVQCDVASASRRVGRATPTGQARTTSP